MRPATRSSKGWGFWEMCWVVGGGAGCPAGGGVRSASHCPPQYPVGPWSKVVRPGPNGPGMQLKEEGIREVFWGKCPRAVAVTFEGSVPGSSCCWGEGDVSICF